MAHEEPEVKRFKHSTISDYFYTSEFQDLFTKYWHNNESIDGTNISVISKPFRVCKISNFIKSEIFMEELKNDLLDVKCRRQSNDLYQFEQTNDLADVKSIHLRRLYETFQTDVASWMEKNTKIELNKKITMSSSCYSDTDYLLCHDDNMGDRRIAFILYLSRNWTAEDGGTLDLFDTDDNGLPRNIVRSLVPEYNSLVFFEVVDNSYHQVAEVTSSEKSRWTISGWFHGTPRVSNRPPRPEIDIEFSKPEDNTVNLDSWITESYLVPTIVKEIQTDVELKSYAFLSNFLKQDIYDKISNDLISEKINWHRVGPADVRNYEIAEISTLPQNLGEFYNIFKSLAIFRLLKDYTELDLVPDEGATMDPKMCIELQRWSKGCYTLICDGSSSNENSLSDDKVELSPQTPTGNDSGSSRVSSKSRNNEKRTRQGSVTSNEEISEDEILRRILKGKSPEPEEKSSSDDKVELSPQTPTSNDSGSSRVSSKSRNNEKRTRQGSVTSNEEISEDEILRRILKGKSPEPEEKSSSDDKVELSPQTPTSNDSGSSRVSSKSRNNEKRTRQGSVTSNEEISEDEILRRILKGKSPEPEEKSSSDGQPQQQASCSKLESNNSPSAPKRSPPLNPDSEDSEVSDIGDYLSDPLDCSHEGSEAEEDAGNSTIAEPGALDVIMQFHTSKISEDDTIDYVDPREEEGSLIRVPSKDNHLCLVYKTVATSRLHKYVNHYCKGYFYNLICTYYE